MPTYTPPSPTNRFKKLQPHEWLKETRKDKGIKQDEIESFTSKLDSRARISQAHLSKIERGHTPLMQLGPIKMDALRQALGLTPEQWVAGTGFTVVKVADDLSIDLSVSLIEASEKYSEGFPDLRDPDWLKLLQKASPHDWDGPETPEEWLALYICLRNHTKPRRR